MIDIDYKLLLVQIATFLLTVFLLWRFLWKSFVLFLEKRKETISSTLDETRRRLDSAKELETEYQEHLKNLEAEKAAIINKAVGNGESARREIIQTAEQDARTQISAARDEIIAEKKRALSELRGETIRISIMIAEKLIRKNIDHKTSEQLADEFIEGIK